MNPDQRMLLQQAILVEDQDQAQSHILFPVISPLIGRGRPYERVARGVVIQPIGANAPLLESLAGFPKALDDLLPGCVSITEESQQIWITVRG